MELADSVRRFQRVIKIGNPMTIKLASRDLINDVPKLKPIDLVNGLKTAASSGNDQVVQAITEECKKRNLKGFNGKDLAVLVSAVNKPDLCLIFERKLSPEFMRTMRTSDLCMCLLGLSKIESKQLPDSVYKFLYEFVKGERIKQFSEINISQVLSALSSKSSLAALERLTFQEQWEIVIKLLEKFLRKLEKESTSFSDKTVAFSLFATVQIFQAVKLPLDHPGRLSFLNKMADEVDCRGTLNDSQLVTCVRALGRARALKKDFVERRLMPILKDLDLNEDQKSGLNAALVSVGIHTEK
jgi:hypothetical protein